MRPLSLFIAHRSEDGQLLFEARGGDWWFLWKTYKDGLCWKRGR
jgi:hypothetical protein